MSTHTHDLGAFRHSHAFGDAGVGRRERGLLAVVVLTLATMAAELLFGWWTGSLALTADGWHMGTHALALGGAVLAYRLSRRAGAGYAFGGWKIEVLAAYTSGIALLAVALWLVGDGISTLRAPHPVAYRDGLVVAVAGLAVNLASALLLARAARPADEPEGVHADERAGGVAPGHRHDDAAHFPHQHAHQHHAQHGHDHNYAAAYWHVVADAFTSVLAIAALAGGAWFGLVWLDPAVAIVGGAVVGRWALGVLRASARSLVDATADPALAERIRFAIESDGDAKLSDLHVWQVGNAAWSAALAVVADSPLPADAYRQRLAPIARLRHVTVEIHRCPGD
jgi:cation diffusion facilitator family transporter